ncbi:MAG: tetratricopeptide repeat protein [Planctomycetota bacterium]
MLRTAISGGLGGRVPGSPGLGMRAGARWVVVTLLAVGIFASGNVVADVFELKNGQRVVGAVIRESTTFVSVKTDSGEVVTIDVGQIVRREKSKSDYDEYLGRKQKLAPNDLVGHLDLAQWCVERKLLEESLFHLRTVITAEPNHVEARKRLGYVRIDGRWYIEGSPEADAARAGDSGRFTAPPVEMPESFEGTAKEASKSTNKGPMYGGSGDRVRFVLKESLGDAKPDYPVANYEVQSFFRSLEKPLALMAEDAAEAAFTMKLEITVRFERTHSFYGRIPITHIFNCEARVEFLDAEGKSALSLGKISMPFSGSARREKADIAKAGHYYLVKTLVSRMSEHKFFAERGAKPIQPPEW